MAVSPEILQHVYDAMNGLPAGEAGKVADELASHYGVVRQTIFRYAAKKGLSWRKERSTKGASRVSDDVLRKAGTLLYASRRTSNDVSLPACDAKEMLEDSGIDTGVSTSWFRTLMSKKNLSARDIKRPSPHVTLLSKHPNHVWQFDVTNCLQYFLDDKGMGERDVEMTMYKNKVVKTAKKIRKELLRYVMVDHCTGAFYMRYFYASGERATDGATFLYEAFRPKSEIMEKVWPEKAKELEEKYRLHGVPFMLVSDKGSILMAKRNQALLEALGIELEIHMPGNPRAKGAVEGLMKIINRFEARLKFQRPSSLEELNRWALDWTIMYNGVKDMRGVAPRSALWSKITNDQLRLCPEEQVFKMLIREPVMERTADGARLISVDNLTYLIPDPNCVKQKVKVVRNAYEYPALDIHFGGHVWLCHPIEKDEYGRLTNGVTYGEHKRPKNTVVQTAKTGMEKSAEELGLTWKGTGDKRRAVAPPAGQESPLKVFGHQAEKVGNVAFMKKNGTELNIKEPALPENEAVSMHAAEVSREIVSRKTSMIRFLKELKSEIGDIPKELNKELKDTYGSSIEIKQAEEVKQRLINGEALGNISAEAVNN